MLPIYENFANYTPPRKFRKTIERLLSTVPPGHLTGLESVVLTNSAKVGRGKTKRIRGRKYPENSCLGFYHPSTSSNGPWIEIVVDNIAASMPDICLRWRVLSDLIISKTLYHEIGHHLDATIGSRSRSGEQAADSWAKQLAQNHFKKRYRVLMTLLRFSLRILRKPIQAKVEEVRRMASRSA